MSGGLAWVNGEFVPRAQARVSIDDFGLRYGLTCFETMLARHGRVFRLAQHLDRLEAGLRLFRAVPPARAALEHAIEKVLRANSLDDASVRLSVTPGAGTRPALPASGDPTVIVTADPLAPMSPRSRLWVSSVQIDSERAWRRAKVGQFAPYLLARAEAEDLGFEDALLLDYSGRIAEAATANVFFELDGVVVTPSLAAGALPGVTRAAILELAAAGGVPAREGDLTLDDLGRATAGFLTSSVAGVVPVTSVSWRVGDASGDWAPSGLTVDRRIVDVIAGAYEALVEAETA